MAGDAPFQYVSMDMLDGTGAIFDDTNNQLGLFQQTYPPPTIPTFTPFGPPRIPQRTAYGPLRRAQNPSLAPSPPASPTRNRLDPTARPFTPKLGPPRLRVETNVPKEQEILASANTRTPRIEVSPADDVGVENDAAIQAVRQLSRNRRQSSPGRRPTGIQRQSSHHGRRPSTSTQSVSGTAMSRVVSAPGRAQAPTFAAGSDTPMPQGFPRPRGNPLLAPVQPMNPADWVARTHNVGFGDQVRRPTAPFDRVDAPSPTPGPRSIGGRSRASNHVSRPIFCDELGCRHRAAGKTFKTLGQLRKHAKTHRPASERPCSCPVSGCSQRFWYPKDVRRHLELVHEKNKVLCPQCDTELCRADDLKRHISTVHNNSRPVASPRNWASASPSVSTVTSFAMTPRSEYSFAGVPSTPPTGSSFASGSRTRAPGLKSFDSIAEDNDETPWSVPMTKSLTR